MDRLVPDCDIYCTGMSPANIDSHVVCLGVKQLIFRCNGLVNATHEHQKIARVLQTLECSKQHTQMF